jgi:uncharacterized protein (TIGR02271 family)
MAQSKRTERLGKEKAVPVVEETAVIYKEPVVTDTVRLHKRVHEEEQVLDIPVRTDAIEVERVPVGRWIDAPVEARREGDTTVYPVVEEEVVVVEKRLRLVEEVRVTRRQATHQVQERVGLRREEIVVERDAPPDAPPTA